jgi:tRNA A58 N-methylase Trm61
MQTLSSHSAPEPYVLATGEAAAHRLQILHGLYGPGTRRVLLEAGLRRGMRVADLGCGVGMVTAWLAEAVGPGGHVVGIDASAAQLAQARRRLHRFERNTSLVEANACPSPNGRCAKCTPYSGREGSWCAKMAT